MAFDTGCMHEFVMTLEKLKKEKDVSAMDVAKALLDNGIHPPTMYFPLIVHEALMVEPTETEPREVLDHAIEVFRSIYQTAMEQPESLHEMPLAYAGSSSGRGWCCKEIQSFVFPLNKLFLSEVSSDDLKRFLIISAIP